MDYFTDKHSDDNDDDVEESVLQHENGDSASPGVTPQTQSKTHCTSRSQAEISQTAPDDRSHSSRERSQRSSEERFRRTSDDDRSTCASQEDLSRRSSRRTSEEQSRRSSRDSISSTQAEKSPLVPIDKIQHTGRFEHKRPPTSQERSPHSLQSKIQRKNHDSGLPTSTKNGATQKSHEKFVHTRTRPGREPTPHSTQERINQRMLEAAKSHSSSRDNVQHTPRNGAPRTSQNKP